MTVPPKLDFDFAQFHQDFCAINMTKLLEESMEYNGNIDFELIVSTINSPYNNTCYDILYLLAICTTV